MFFQSDFYIFASGSMNYARSSYGEGGPRNGGWGPTGCRSVAASGSCPFRPVGLQGIFLNFFPFRPIDAQCLVSFNDKAYLCLNGNLHVCRNSLSFNEFYRVFGFLSRQVQLFSRLLKCFISGNFPTGTIILKKIPTPAINPDNYNKKPCHHHTRIRS